MKGKKLSSRICAALLAICMLVQLMPAYAAPAPNADGLLVYNFNQTAIGGNNLAAATFEKAGWRFNDEESDASWTYNKTSAGWANVNNTSITPAIDATRKSIAFDLDVPEDSYYAISLKANASGAAGTYEVYVNGGLVKSLDVTTSAATYSIGSKYLKKGANSVRIRYAGTDNSSKAWLQLYNITLTPEPDRATETTVLDFRAPAPINNYYDMTIADQGLRFIHHGATVGYIQNNAFNNKGSTGGWSSFNNSNGATLQFNAVGNYAGFDFKVDEAGKYDLLVTAAPSFNNGIAANFTLNKENTPIGNVDITPAKTAATEGKRTVYKVGTIDVDAGINMFKMTATKTKGVGLMYFREGLALVGAEDVSTAWSVTSSTGDKTAENTYKLDKGENAIVSVTVPEYGLYYVYAIAENRADGFVGTVLDSQKYTQYMDVAGSYSADPIDSNVTRVFGPFWLPKGASNVTFTQQGTSGVLKLADIEAHPVVKKLDLIDKAEENYSGFSIKANGWELDKETTDANYYKRLMLGAYMGAETYVNSSVAANWTDINLNSGNVGFKFETPTEGRYKLVGTFRRNGNADNPKFSIPDAGFNTTLSVSSSTDLGVQDIEIGTVDLAAGEHSMVFSRGTGTNGYLYLQKLTLIPEVMPSEVRVTVNSKNVTVGESFDVHADVAMNNGTVVSLPIAETGDPESGYITLTSSDESVMTIADGVATAHKASDNVKINAVAYIKGKTLRKSVGITVGENPADETFTLTLADVFPMAANVRRDVLIQGAVDKVIVDLNNADVTVDDHDSKIVSAQIVKKNGNVYLRMETNALGEETITVNASYDGLDASIDVPVSVVENPESTKTTIINFGTPLANELDDLDLDVHGWELDPQPENTKLWAKIAAGHSHFSKGSDMLLHFNYDNEADEGEYALFNIKIDRTGWYALSFTGMYNLDYGAVASFEIDGEFVGEFDFTDPDGMDSRITDVVARFRDVYLTEGVHQLKVQRINPQVNTRHAIVYLYNMQFVPLADKTTVAGFNVVSDRDKLLLGDSTNVSYTLRLSDGTDYHFPKLYPNQGSTAMNTTTPDRVTYTDGVVTSKGYGKGNFEIVAERPGEEKYIANWGIETAQGQMFSFKRENAADVAGATVAKDNWALIAEETTATPGALNTNGLNASFAQNQILALELNILKTGIYDMDIVGMTADDGAVADLYMDDAYLGRFDFSGDKAAEQLNSLSLDGGRHTLYIKGVTAGNIYADRLVLTETDALPTVDHISVQAESDSVIYNKTLATSIKVFMSNGREFHFGKKLDGSEDTENYLTFKSGDEDVFTVDKDGVITGIWTGSADLEVTAVINSEPHNYAQQFSTVRVLEISTGGEMFGNRLETISTALSAVLDDDESTQLADAEEIWVETSDPEKITGEVKVDEETKTVTLNVTGMRNGDYYVTVYAILDGVKGSAEIPVKVFAPTETVTALDLNFVKGYSGSPDGATIAADGWCVNYDLTSPLVGKRANTTWGLSANGFDSTLMPEEQLAIDFLVKEPGNYSLSFMGSEVGNYGTNAAFYIDGMYVGTFNFAHPSDSDDASVRNREVVREFNSLYLGQGTHTIVIKSLYVGSVNRHNTLYMAAFDFEKLDGELYFKDAVATVGKDSLIIGESTELTTGAQMSDGSWRKMGNLMDGSADTLNNITVTNSNPSVAEIKDGRVIAKAKGDTKITVTAMVDGEEKSASVDIHVSDATVAEITAEVVGDVYVGKTADIEISAKASNGADIDVSCLTVTTTAENSDIASGNGATVTGLSAGDTNITVTAGFNENNSASVTIPITVLEDGLVGIKVSAIPRLIRPDSEGTQITVTGGSYQGFPIDLSTAEITYTTEATDIIDLSPTGYVTPKALGSALVKVKVVANGGTFVDEGEVNIVVTNGKVGRSFYTDEKVAAAKENRQKYSWARSEIDGIIRTADKYVEQAEFLWGHVTSQDLPRSTIVGYDYDPDGEKCRYCGDDLGRRYGNPIYSYNVDPINLPWKIQCKTCRKIFPTNDFGSYYKLGIVEKGEEAIYGIPAASWSYEKSHYEHYMLFADEYAAKGVESYEEHKAMREAGERLPAVGYLKNELYPEVASVETLNGGKGLNPETETVEGWGVDDGRGYKTGHVYPGTNWGDIEETHAYMAMYNRFMMGTDTLMDTVVQSLSQAYMITGEAKYGRTCAVVLDRIADVYPDMDIGPEPHWRYSHSGGIGNGKLEGSIWENDTLAKWIAAYDAVWPIYDDPEVVKFLNTRATYYGMENDKSTPELIRENIENGIVRETVEAIKNGDAHGNFGLHQVPGVYAAIVLDTMPETKNILDWLMQYDKYYLLPYNHEHTGGEILHKLYNDVDRDGGTTEGMSPNYQNLWYNTMADIANILNGYTTYSAADLFKLPKLNVMLKNQMNYIMCRKGSLPIGDSTVMAGLTRMLPSYYHLIRAYYATGDYELAQMVYWQNGNKVDGLKLDIYTKDPEKIQQDVKKVIDEHGEYDFDRSVLLAGTGLAVMRDGSLYAEGTTDEYDNQRDFWMGFGLKGVHGHADTLGIGLHAYGLDFAPDFGYPAPPDLSDKHRNWGMSTLSHNTVVVDDRPHSALNRAGFPLHFDNTDRVSVMDVEAPEVSPATDIYRRTVVMIEANDDVSYGVDFFRVKGGDEHVYSFHSQSHEIGDWAGFRPEVQENGTYAGENVAYGTTGHVSGYSYLTDVRKDTEPGTGEVMVEFNVTDYRKAIKDSSDMHLRLTMLNDFDLSNVSLVKGEPPNKAGNPEWIEFFLARRSGNDLDSTFTTVIEPYQGERYIKETEQVSVKRADGEDINANGDVVRAIKVTLDGGREDYVIYATNNQVEYIIDEDIRFKGFVGVYTVNNGEMLSAYLNHGTTLGEMDESTSEYNGEIVDFTRGMKSFENDIIVSFNDAEKVDVENLAGRYIFVENDGAMNGAYGIKSATDNGDGTVSLHLGNCTLVRSATNITAEDADYVYNIAPKQYFTIPLSVYEDTVPVFSEHDSDYNLTAGKKFSKTITATCEDGRSVTYSSPALPRGASINPTTGEISWTPDNTQVGKNHIAVCADDGVSQSTIHLNLTVYKSSGSVSGGSSSDNSGNDSSGTDTGNNSGNNQGTQSGAQSGTQSGSQTPSGEGSGSGTGSSSGSGGGASGGGGGGGGGGSSSGGSSDTSDNTGTEDNNTDVGTGVPDGPSVPTEKFIDLGSHAWAEDAIYSLVDAGVVNGTSENTYSPAANIKRADFAIMLVRAFGVTEGETEQFADVDASKYYAKELLLAKANGIVGGIGSNRFNPEGEITRQDMMLMLVRALEAQGKKLDEADESVLAEFADAAEISDYARQAVASVVKAGIIAGSNGRINPLAKATRAEIAVMLNRVLAK